MKKTPRILITFLGIDGSGKSTNSLKLYRILQENGINCRYAHYDSFLIDHIPTFLRKKVGAYSGQPKTKEKDNMTGGIKNKFFVTVIILEALIDGIFGYLKDYPAIKNKSVTIYDRYFYDSILSYIKLCPTYLLKIFIRIIPRPDIIFFLNIDPKKAYIRKRENHVSILTRNHENYLSFLKLFPINSVVTIDSELPKEKVFDYIYKKVKRYLVERGFKDGR